jgi:hypothetical protein
VTSKAKQVVEIVIVLHDTPPWRGAALGTRDYMAARLRDVQPARATAYALPFPPAFRSA